MALTTSALRRAWAPACRLAAGTTLTLNGGGRVHVDGRVVDAVRALNACLVAWRYQATAPDVGAYNCRPITGGTNYSLHAYGIALDLNWLANPYRTDGRVVTDMDAGMVGAIVAIRTVSGAQVWRWGGAYAGNVKDAMHYEVVCTPADLASGIDWTTVPGRTPKVPYAWVPTERLAQGSHRPAVARVQLALELLRPFTGGPHLTISDPPGYGPITVDSVTRFQRFARSMQRLAGETSEAKLIDVDGVWGPQTAAAARFWLPSASATAKAAA